MKKASLITAMLVSASMTSLASASLRTVSVGDTIRLDYSPVAYRTGNGGEFQVDKVAPTAINDYFHTFCAEIGEYIYDDEIVIVKSLGLTSQASLPVNTLTYGAAKLFSDYYQGIAASNYGFGVGTDFVLGAGSNAVTFRLSDAGGLRALDGSAVQIALWNLIGEVDAPAPSGDSAKLYNYYINAAIDSNYYGVRLANLVAVNGDRRQDQFVMVVPEVATLAVWSGLSLLGLAAYRRSAKLG